MSITNERAAEILDRMVGDRKSGLTAEGDEALYMGAAALTELTRLRAELAELRKPVEVLPKDVDEAILAYRRAGQTFDRSEPDISGAGWPRLPGVLVALNNLRSAILKFANERGGGK